MSVAGADHRLLLRAADGFVFVDIGDIRHVSVEGNYLRVFAGQSEYVVRGTMGELSNELRSAGFLRISRSDLVNVARIRAINRHHGGRYQVALDGGQSLMSSRRYRTDIRAVILNLC
jgi:DNA-binding LytR/AlgR family response regulator